MRITTMMYFSLGLETTTTHNFRMTAFTNISVCLMNAKTVMPTICTMVLIWLYSCNYIARLSLH